MGLLSRGTPLSWEQSRRYHDYIKTHGILQFLNIYRAMKDRANDIFLWGDEVEHMLVTIDNDTNTVRLSLRAPELLEQLEGITSATNATSSEDQHNDSDHAANDSHRWHAHFVPEYGRFMIEATPAMPYGGYTSDLRMVEPNMRLRRTMVQRLLKSNELIVTMTAFPMMGVGRYCEPYHHPYGPIAQSLYISDGIIGPHPRFATLSRNIRIRRGCKVSIRVPLFIDTNTVSHLTKQLNDRQTFLDQQSLIQGSSKLIAEEEKRNTALTSASLTSITAKPPIITSGNNTDNHGNELYPPVPDSTCVPPIDEMREIHMDAMAFGMGSSCLQVTFQTRSINEARHLYDHLAVLSPIMLALSAATPFHRGRVADSDVRWSVISQSVDDRTNVERGDSDVIDPSQLERKSSIAEFDTDHRRVNVEADREAQSLPPSHRTPQRLSKSRYDSISSYLSLEDDFKPDYNDIPCEIDRPSYEKLLSEGIDELLARHIAHLFIRDPLVIYDESVIQDDTKSNDHFENIQSTNWQTVRFKPPPPSTDTNTNMGWRVEFRTMEVQLTDFENAAYTVFVALISRALLYFKLNFYLPLSLVDDNLDRAHRRDAVLGTQFHWRLKIKECPDDSANASDAHRLMSVADIMLGNDCIGTIGLIPTIKAYLDAIQCDSETRTVVDGYLTLLEYRATGQLLTCASWLRKFVNVHPDYEHDSQLKQSIVCDLVRTIQQIQNGGISVTQLLGNLPSHPPTDSHANSGSDSKGVPLRGAPTRLDLNDEQCCDKFRAYLKQYAALSQCHPPSTN